MSKNPKKKKRAESEIKNIQEEEKKNEEYIEEAPLTQMVVKAVYEYKPIETDGEFITSAMGNTEQGAMSQIIFKPLALKHLFSHIGWGKRTSFNKNEQIGILVGQVYKTPNGYTGVVEDALLSRAKGERAYIEASHSEWYELEKKLKAFNENRKNKQVIIGWWHTHPNMNVFMSSVDLANQKRYYSDWQFAVVLNPQEKKWASFVGEESQPCAGFFANKNFFRYKEKGGKKK